MRWLALLLALALAASACADSSPPAESSTDRLQLALRVTPDPLVSGMPATFELAVTNTSDEDALLTFDTTEHGDVAFVTNDVEVYRWSERRAFALDDERYALVPGQQTTFELEADPLPVGPGEYEILATVTGVPKLRSIRTSATVTSGTSEAPSPTATAGAPALSAAYDALDVAVTTTVDELALPVASALADDGAFGADGAVVRQQVADAMSALTFAELLLAYRTVAGGDVEAARAFATPRAEGLAATVAGLRSVEAVDRRELVRLLDEHVTRVAEYAEVVAAGGGGTALQAPRRELEQIDVDLGTLIGVTSGGAIDTDDAAELFASWTDRLLEAVRDGADADPVAHAHEVAAVAVEPVALEVAHAYVRYLDLDGFEATAGVLRQELATQLGDEVFLLATAVDVGALDRDAVADVLDENADEVAEAIAVAPAISETEQSAFLQLWRARVTALLAATAAPDGATPERLADIDDEIARQLADATDGAVSAEELSGWLTVQREALLDALRSLAA